MGRMLGAVLLLGRTKAANYTDRPSFRGRLGRLLLLLSLSLSDIPVLLAAMNVARHPGWYASALRESTPNLII
jgi:hypothetical protein